MIRGMTILALRPIMHIESIDARYPSDPADPCTSTRGGGVADHVARIGLTRLFVPEANGVLAELKSRG